VPNGFLISAQDWQRKVALTGLWLGNRGQIARFVMLECPLWPFSMAMVDGIVYANSIMSKYIRRVVIGINSADFHL